MVSVGAGFACAVGDGSPGVEPPTLGVGVPVDGVGVAVAGDELVGGPESDGLADVDGLSVEGPELAGGAVVVEPGLVVAL